MEKIIRKSSKYTMGKKLDLLKEQKATLNRPKLKSNIFLKMMYLTMDIVYGFKRTLPKFKVIEILARYPYQAWESGSYKRISKQYSKKRYTNIKDTEYSLRHIEMGRHSQDNEQWHLMLIEDIMRQKKIKQGFLHHHVIPRFIVFGYYFFTRIMYNINPKWSFAMNAAFESHAEHEYMLMASEYPEWEKEKLNSKYFDYYPKQKNLLDLVRRIGLDERDHMNESLDELSRLGKLKKRV